jgi:hypothetical protein
LPAASHCRSKMGKSCCVLSLCVCDRQVAYAPCATRVVCRVVQLFVNIFCLHVFRFRVLMNNITKSGYTKPTAVQRHAIPILLEGRDLMGCARTGTPLHPWAH